MKIRSKTSYNNAGATKMDESAFLKTLPNFSFHKYSNEKLIAIDSLRIAIKSDNNTNQRRAFQALPRSLRRRAASHNPKRVPRRYVHLLELKKKDLAGKRKTSQKSMSRSSKKSWLPCHLWYAKRFKMAKQGNYMVPQISREKSFRKSYYAARNRAFIFDLSFYNMFLVKRSDLDHNYIIRQSDKCIHSSFIINKNTKELVCYSFLFSISDEIVLLVIPPSLFQVPSSFVATQYAIWLIHGPTKDKIFTKVNDMMDSSFIALHSKLYSLICLPYGNYEKIHKLFALSKNHDLRIGSCVDFEQLSFDLQCVYPTIALQNIFQKSSLMIDIPDNLRIGEGHTNDQSKTMFIDCRYSLYLGCMQTLFLMY